MTTWRYEQEDWPSINRPRDLGLDGVELTFEEFDFAGSLPRRIRVTDAHNNSCTYLVAIMVIVEPNTERQCLTYKTLEHDEDLMPQVIFAKDERGNYCGYEPWHPNWPIPWGAVH